jgi:hypothetical protein
MLWAQTSSRPEYPASAQARAMVVKRSRSRASSRWAASRSYSPAIVTIMANSRPPVSTAM